MIRRIKIFIICLIYSFTVLALMDGLISHFLFMGELKMDIHIFVYNLIFLLCFTLFVVYFLGEGLGTIVMGFITILIVCGNLIKLIYHNSVLKPGDFILISELIGISGRFIMPWHIALCTFAAAVIVFLLFKFRRAVLKAFIPKPMIFTSILFLCIFAVNCFMVKSDDLYSPDRERIPAEGFAVFNYLNIKDYMNVFPKAPDDYSEERMLALRDEFDAVGSSVTDVKPDVVVVLLESYFDVGKAGELGLSDDVTKYARKYTVGNMIAPKYGGGTAATEFELLTGIPISLFPDGVIPYDVYMQSDEKKVSSIVKEFKNNGYSTTAVHPSTASFYGRDKAYKELEFDKFLTINDFDVSENDMTNDEMTKDFKVRDKIEEILDNGKGSEFIFAITFESHCPYVNKFGKNDINFTAEGEGISEGNKKELLQYSRCAYDSSRMVYELVKYIETRDKPTLLICFGDHLPPLGALRTSGYIDDPYKKYCTPIIEFANYPISGSTGEEYISPYQLSSYILQEAGIKHSSYFDYISSIRNKVPIINRDFDVDFNSEEIDKLRLVQYDIMFGEQYILKNRK